MGMTKRLFEQEQEERYRKQEELLDLPERVAESNRRIGELQTELRFSAETIESLEQQLIDSNSLRANFKHYVVAGIVGAILGVVFSWLL